MLSHRYYLHPSLCITGFKKAALLLGAVLVSALPALASLQSEHVTPKLLYQIAEQHIREHVPVCDNCSLQLTWHRQPGISQLNDLGPVRITAESALDQHLSSRTIVRLHLKGTNGKSRLIGLPVSIAVERPVWVSRGRLSPGQSLLAKDLVLKRKAIGYGLEHQWPADWNPKGYEARVGITAGSVIDTRNSRKSPVIRPNQEVRIFMASGGKATCAFPGTALQEGYVGQTIRVRQTLYKRKDYLATVIAPGRVEVNL